MMFQKPRMRRRLMALIAALPVMCASLINLPASGASKDQLNAETNDDGNGILATRISTPQGMITVNLPNDLSRSDTISGTVIAEPSGDTPEVQKQHSDEIGGYVVEVQKAEQPPEEPPPDSEPQVAQVPPTEQTPPPPECTGPSEGGCTPKTHKKHKEKPKKNKPYIPPVGTCTPPTTNGCMAPVEQQPPETTSCKPSKTKTKKKAAPPSEGCQPTTTKTPPRKTSCAPKTKGQKGAPITATPKNPGFVCAIPKDSKGITLVLKDPKGKVVARQPIAVNPTPPPTNCSPGTVNLPSVGTLGRPVQIKAPTSGNSKTGLVKIGGKPCIPLAKSPRQVVVNTPENVTGPCSIEYQEGGKTAKGQFNNLQLNVSCAKTTLDKGESSTIVIKVSGMQGMKGPVRMRITNLNPGTVTLSGGNQQSFVINTQR